MTRDVLDAVYGSVPRFFYVLFEGMKEVMKYREIALSAAVVSGMPRNTTIELSLIPGFVVLEESSGSYLTVLNLQDRRALSLQHSRLDRIARYLIMCASKLPLGVITTPKV